MKNNKVNFIVRQAIIIALYVTLTVANPLSYSNIQFRIAEILVFLCFFKKDYIIGLSLGCLIANFFSPMMIYDVSFGLVATIISLILICYSKNLYIAGIWPVLINAILVGLELHLAFDYPLLISMLQVGAGELAVIIVGIMIFKALEKNKRFMYIITNDSIYDER